MNRVVKRWTVLATKSLVWRFCGGALLLLMVAVAGAGCQEKEPHALLTIEDPYGLAATYIKFAVGENLNQLTKLEVSSGFPVVLTLSAKSEGERSLWIEALGASGMTLGRGAATLNFTRKKPETRIVELYAVCDSAGENDGLPCVGGDFDNARVCQQGACRSVACGDAILCSAEVCSVGSLGVPEECDDGNSDEADACLSSCKSAVCGDGFLRTDGQELLADDPTPCLNDGECSNEEYCFSDGYCYPVGYEECDLGADNGGFTCSSDCLANVCGDGIQNTDMDEEGNPIEGCDDANNNPNDGCHNCSLTTWTVADTLLVGQPNAATEIFLQTPRSLTVALNGTIYVTDSVNRKIWSLSPDGAGYQAQVFAGTGTEGFSGDGGRATLASFMEPVSLVLDRDSNLYVADRGANCVRRIDTEGIISTFAGVCGEHATESTVAYSGDPTGVHLHQVQALALGSTEKLLIADTDNVREVDLASNALITYADLLSLDCSDCSACSGCGDCWDGFVSEKFATKGQHLIVNHSGELFISDAAERRIFKIEKSSTTCPFEVFAGTGASCAQNASCGGGGAATAARFNRPEQLAWDSSESALLVADAGLNRIRKIHSNATLTDLAGNGATCWLDDDETCAQGLEFTSNPISAPVGLAIDTSGNLYVSEYGEGLLQKLGASDNLVERIAGKSAVGEGLLGATSQRLEEPSDMVYDPLVNQIYFTERSNHRILAYQLSSGVVYTVAGSGQPCLTPEYIESCGDGESVGAEQARLNLPTSLALDQQNNILYFSDHGTFRIRKVDLTHRYVESVVGSGVQCEGVFENADACLHGKTPAAARLMSPRGLTFDLADNLYFTEPERHQIFRASLSDGSFNNLERVSADACQGESLGDGLFAEAGSYNDCEGAPQDLLGDSHFNEPYDLVFHTGGDLFVADRGNYRVRRVIANCASQPCTLNPSLSTVTSIVGDGTGCCGELAEGEACTDACGDGGDSDAAQLIDPQAIDLLYSEEGPYKIIIGDRMRVRQSSATTLTTLAGSGAATFFGDFYSNASDAGFVGLTSVLVVDSDIYAVDSGAGVLRKLEAAASGPNWQVESVVGNVLGGSTGELDEVEFISPRSIVSYEANDTHRKFFVSLGHEGRTKILTLDGSGEDTLTPTLENLVGYRGGFTQADEATLTISAGQGRLLEEANGLAYDAAANALYMSESSGHTIRCINLADTGLPIVTVAGTFADAGYTYVAGDPLSSKLNRPTGLALDSRENIKVLYIADTGNHVVRSLALHLDDPCVVSDGETLELFAGQAEVPGIINDTGNFAETYLNAPEAVVVNGNGEVYVADTQNHRVRRFYTLLAAETIETVVGIGIPGQGGSGTPASNFQVEEPNFLLFDSFDNLWISSSQSINVVSVGSDGVVRGDDAFLTVYGAPPRQEFPESENQCLGGFALYAGDETDDSLLLLDSCLGYMIPLSR